MESSGRDIGDVTAVRKSDTSVPHATPAFMGRSADPAAVLLPVSSSTVKADHGDLPRAQAGDARRRVRRRPRRGPQEEFGPSGRRPIPVRVYAYMHLKALILSDRFAPGQRLAEERLAREFGISRTPIREALHKLETEGLVTPLSRRGFAAPSDSRREMEELIDLRAVLEGYALRVVCGRATERQIQGLERIVRRTEDALRCGRLCELSRWNTRFHDMLHGLISDRRRLYHHLVTMRRYAFRYRRSTGPVVDGGHRTVEGHRRIVMALRFRDPDLCECAMREHIRQPQPDPVQPLETQSPQDGASSAYGTHPLGTNAPWLSASA